MYTYNILNLQNMIVTSTKILDFFKGVAGQTQFLFFIRVLIPVHVHKRKCT